MYNLETVRELALSEAKRFIDQHEPCKIKGVWVPENWDERLCLILIEAGSKTSEVRTFFYLGYKGEHDTSRVVMINIDSNGTYLIKKVRLIERWELEIQTDRVTLTMDVTQYC